MALLPNGYIVCDGVEKTYDSGVLSASDLEINGLFHDSVMSVSTANWFFGSRNTNSTTSAGQLNFDVVTGGSNTYFGCGSARTSLTDFQLEQTFWHIYVLNNYFEFSTVNQVWETTGSATAFTGTRTMYINGMNNAGSLASGRHPDVVCGFIIKKNGTLIKSFIPCIREADSQQGLYDLVGEEFVEPVAGSTSNNISRYLAEVSANTGGKAFLKTIRGEKVEKEYVSKIYNTDYISDPTRGRVECVAEPEEGYEFKNWTIGGSVVSTERVYAFSTLSDVSIVANFQKKAMNLNMNHRLIVTDESGEFVDLEVLDASVTDDSLEKTTSTIRVKEIPSFVRAGLIATLRSPKGETLYNGVVNSISGNTITCREMLSLFDRDYIFKPTTFDEDNYTARHSISYLIGKGRSSRDFSSNMDGLLFNWLGLIFYDEKNIEDDLSLYEEENSVVTTPTITDTGVQNLEDYILAFSNFGIYVSYEKILGESAVMLVPRYFRNNDTLTISDNIESISNVSVTIESQENTIVNVFDSAGTLRGMYGVRLDGSIGRYDVLGEDLTQYLGNTNYYGSVVMSDDPLNTILAENLSLSGLNHKITFDIQFSDMLPFDKFKIGTPVDFYNGGDLYKSVITAVSFEVSPNIERITNAKITLGNVRTSLTSKLNLGKK